MEYLKCQQVLCQGVRQWGMIKGVGKIGCRPGEHQSKQEEMNMLGKLARWYLRGGMKGRVISDVTSTFSDREYMEETKKKKSLTYLRDLKDVPDTWLQMKLNTSIRVVKQSMSPEQESDRKETHDGRGREKSNRFPRLDVRRELWDQTLVSQKRQDVTQLKLWLKQNQQCSQHCNS